MAGASFPASMSAFKIANASWFGFETRKSMLLPPVIAVPGASLGAFEPWSLHSITAQFNKELFGLTSFRIVGTTSVYKATRCAESSDTQGAWKASLSNPLWIAILHRHFHTSFRTSWMVCSISALVSNSTVDLLPRQFHRLKL